MHRKRMPSTKLRQRLYWWLQQRSARGLAVVIVPDPRQTFPRIVSNLSARVGEKRASCSANEGRARNKWCGDLMVGSQTPTVKGSSFKRVRARHSTNEHQCKRNSKVLEEPSPYLPVKHFMVFKAITVVGAIPPKVKLQSLICHELEFVCFSSCTLMAVFTMAMSSSRLRACLKANMCSCC